MVRVKKAVSSSFYVEGSHKESLLYGWEESPTECSFLFTGCQHPMRKLTLQHPQQLASW